jgi:pheromone shutdown protein TraB
MSRAVRYGINLACLFGWLLLAAWLTASGVHALAAATATLLLAMVVAILEDVLGYRG